MKIERIISGGLMTNGYLVYDEQTMKGYIIDPDGNANCFLNKIKALGFKLKGIILTHSHYDHRGAVEKIIKQYDCKVLIHEKEPSVPFHVTYLKEGDEITFGINKLRVINTPGHTKGSICLISSDGKTVFTGDTIFNVDLGRTDLIGGSFNDMKKSIKETVTKWSKDTTIYPGHGDPCTMEYVRKHNYEYNAIIDDEMNTF